MRKIAITGATGFLGRHLTSRALKEGFEVVALGNSETRIKDYERLFPKVPLYSIDVSSDTAVMKSILRKHQVDAVIHTAALKHVGICEKNVSRAIDVNILGTKNLLDAVDSCGIESCVLISTDKSIDPSCVYGMTKLLNERVFLERGFSVFQGVNFFYSDGSVLDIWEKQMRVEKKISVSGNAVRYFTLAEDVSSKILCNLDARSKFTVDDCYKIRIPDLQKAFSEYWNYDNVEAHELLSVEKVEEALPPGISVIEPNVHEIAEIIRLHKLSEIF